MVKSMITKNMRVVWMIFFSLSSLDWSASVQNNGNNGFRTQSNSIGGNGDSVDSYPFGNTIQSNTLQPAPVGGPNVCRSRHKTYCCPGWTQKPNTGLCVIPICRPCGRGRCVKPNICLCEGGTVASNCSDSRGDGRRPSQSGPGNSGGSGNGSPSHVNGGNQIFCFNGGTPVNSKCICRPGYQGEFCGEPVCREPCLHSGRCIGPDRCACVYGYTGRRCESDYRTGPCFTKTNGATCGGQLLGVVCTRNLCCATVGKAWGHPCEQCPSQLDCDHGYLKNVHSGACVEVDECEAIPGLCEGGRCVNTIGSFKCECPPGQIPKDGTSGPCEDLNECLKPGTCNNGRCINTEKGYYCLCDRGFIPTQDQKLCIDARQGNCFTSVLRGLCRGKLSVRLTKRDCCCGINMGKGWGDENNCEVCPSTETNQYKALCSDSSGPGQIAKIDECGLRPELCGNGKCIDLMDGYRCECSPGYSQKTPMSPCEDFDECRLQVGLCQGGRCVNTQGSYTCICPTGFDVSSDGRLCIDHDECSETGMCANGVCHNMDGSFKCQCKEGYMLSPTGHSCVDLNECEENPGLCLAGNRCQNTVGSYKCLCLDGFTPSIDQAFCVDRDECKDNGVCENGRCVDVYGSFRCVCNPGYNLGPTGRNCIDLNECENSPCSGGRCINGPGSYKCDCLPGFSIGPDGTTCLDIQRDLCYAQYRDGFCSAPSSTAVPRSTCCCCTVVLGQPMGWGTPCRACPLPNTPEFDLLCPHGPGMTHSGDDINECLQNPCTNGACENLPGTYRCICEVGYQGDSTGKKCVDRNECELDEFLCSGGQCKNTLGSFTCTCPQGTQYDSRSQVCQDVDECRDSTLGVCPNGQCVNTVGSFQCQCNDGFVQDNSGRYCIDNRKGNCWTKAYGGKCEGNLKRLMSKTECCCSHSVGAAWGSPCEPCDLRLCECSDGFAKLDGKTCVDINECDLHPSICSGGGKCLNTEGSFTCTCPPGLELEADGTRCVDRREDLCYMQLKRGECTHALEGHYLKSDCCCTVGRAWGRECLQCPRPGNEAFAQLCPRGIGTSGTGRKDINECTMIPGICENGRCRNNLGSFTCRCNQGYALDEDGIKCIDINECGIMGSVCGRGICRNIPGSFACDCEEGFESTMVMQVCMDIDECQRTPGLCLGGKCFNSPGSFRCECPPGLELAPNQRECKDIDECSKSSEICSNGICENLMGTFQCQCNDGYQQTGSNRAHCEDVNECQVNNGGCQSACLNTPGSYTCACSPGYMLLLDGKSCKDIDECVDSRQCNGGKCSNIPGSYECECTKGLLPSPDGSTCLDLDECKADPLICNEAGKCENAIGSFHCRCDDGFSVRPELGTGCEDEDECLMGNFNCAHNAECVNSEGSYDCRCTDGYTGDGIVCRDRNECEVNNGGCHPDAQCINTDGSFRCACDVGYEGDGYTCVDVDECMDNPSLCSGHGQCLNFPGSFLCECDHGFMNRDSDKQSCVDIDECTIFPEICINGRCENILGAFRCTCNKGYHLDSGGGNCSDANECDNPHACLYGTCINRPGSYICECPTDYDLVENGNACVDRRKSQCYLDTGDDPRGRRPFGRRECTRPVGELMTRASCCCSVGVNWGPLCEACPAVGSDEHNYLCAGGSGFRPNGNTVVLEDIDECSEMSHLCAHGKCTNTFGSFMCTCDPGYRLDFTKAMCTDLNECIEEPGVCGVGECVNQDGGYHCLCPIGYMLLPNGRECVDMRKEPCFMDFNVTTLKCAQPMGSRQTRMLCCCSMGAGWGDACLPCPKSSTPEYASLCGLKPGQIMNPVTGQSEEIDECALIPQMCRNGICINTPTSFRCECYRGFEYDEVLHTCIDTNECLRSPSPCHGNAQCINVPGSFECRCPEGYRLDHSQRGCLDMNECIERQGICSYGQCNNYQGSFQCICRAGFTLTLARDTCVDLDECQKNPKICGTNGTCMNKLGSYSCMCQPGFKLSSNNECEDIDECQMMLGNPPCRNGRCRNTEGSFTCQCADGYVLTPDSHNCRDLNECIEVPNTCPPPGTCQNFFGSFICSCPSGYELASDGNSCTDLNECVVNSGSICIDGTCHNYDGGFRCDCSHNFNLSPDGKRCVDIRQDFCYDSIQTSGQFGRPVCINPRRGYLSRASCCCTGGRAYSSACEQCPSQGTREFEKLCPEGVGRGVLGEDLDECALLPDLCDGGDCVNSDGSFRCECQSGYRLDTTGRKCIDENECSTGGICGNGTCFNTNGGFECSCADGFTPGSMQVCEDLDECKEGRHHCAFRCHNTIGSYKCACPFGYALAPDGKHCNDMDECATANNCKFLCKNLIGSFMCICPEGYQQIGPGDDCRDINECIMDENLCKNGRCVNMQGAYRCDCFEGYEPSSDFSECIDRRQGFCFRNGMGGQCFSRDFSTLARTTKEDCCCTMGSAWQTSPRAPCEACPKSGTSAYSELCMEEGFDAAGQDLNECDILQDLCKNGVCHNLLGSYKCICHKGYKADTTGTRCIDINECELPQGHKCSHICQNTDGSYICTCPAGYSLGSDGITCRDIDECTIGQPCPNECINTQGSYKCACAPGYTQNGEQCLDMNECTEGICGPPGTCINTLGSFKCICPRGFTTDTSGTHCIDSNECTSDTRCQHGCQNSHGSYRCTCPEGYSQHYYYNQCLDEDECSIVDVCGQTALCRNTIGSYQCQCPNGQQFDAEQLRCVQLTGSCVGSPCAFGCSSYGSDYACGCPSGYRHIGQGHCLATITPPAYGAYGGAEESFGSDSSDQYIATEGCFSCKVGASSRRNRRSILSNLTISNLHQNEIVTRHHTEVDDQMILIVPMDHTRPRYKILQLQPSVKQMNGIRYSIVKGNELGLFEVSGEAPAVLHFKQKIRMPRTYDLELFGYSTDPAYYETSRKDPFTLRIRLIVTN